LTGIIVLFERQEEARGIRGLLVRNGYETVRTCNQGGQALSIADELQSGILICGYRYADMTFTDMVEDMPRGFSILLLARGEQLEDGAERGAVTLEMPLKTTDFLSTLDMMFAAQERERKKRHATPAKRTPEEQKLIGEAKSVLMGRNHMTEDEAHRYLQKCSMSSGTGLVEAAQMVIAMLDK